MEIYFHTTFTILFLIIIIALYGINGGFLSLCDALNDKQNILFKLPSLLSIFRWTMCCYIISWCFWFFLRWSRIHWWIICLIHSTYIFHQHLSSVELFIWNLTQIENICSNEVLILLRLLPFDWIFLWVILHTPEWGIIYLYAVLSNIYETIADTTKLFALFNIFSFNFLVSIRFRFKLKPLSSEYLSAPFHSIQNIYSLLVFDTDFQVIISSTRRCARSEVGLRVLHVRLRFLFFVFTRKLIPYFFLYYCTPH